MFKLLCFLFVFVFAPPAQAQSSAEMIKFAATTVGTADPAIFSEAIRSWVVSEGRAEIAKLQILGPVVRISSHHSQFTGDLWLSVGRAEHERGVSDWKIIFSTLENKVIRTSLRVSLAGELYPAAPTIGVLGIESIAPNGVCVAIPQACGNTTKHADPRVVEFLYATTRRKTAERGRLSYTGERGEGVTLGSARVRIPEDHRIGRIELPSSLRMLTISLYEAKPDQDKHFIIQATKELSLEEWRTVIAQRRSDEALIFVHGFNTGFDDSLYRMAQIVWDLQYQGLPILFSWPSAGGVFDYIYDQQSALGARDHFLSFLRELRQQSSIRRINIVAHSMGNFLVLEALTAASRDAASLAAIGGISELIMAAPDVDRDYFESISDRITQVASGLTLYASAADKAMIASRSLARMPRAGDIPESGPLVRTGIETIDVTALGQDMLGLNHGVFSSSRSVLNDIGLIISSAPRKLPHLRIPELRRVPELSEAPLFWRYSY